MTFGRLSLLSHLTLVLLVGVAARQGRADVEGLPYSRFRSSSSFLETDPQLRPIAQRRAYREKTPPPHSSRAGVATGRRGGWSQPQPALDALFRSNVKWGTYAEFQFKPGTQRVLGDGLLFLPLWQDDTSLLFADIRGQGDDGNNSEGNWGLGLRSIIDDRWIVGGYAYYDRRWTEHSNEIPQLTVGMEALSVTWEARVNGYLPDTNVKTIGQIVTSGSPRAVFDGNTILVVTDGRSQAFETAYWGVDAEIGMLLAEIGNRGNVELRGFVGGFHFGTNENLPNISGPRSRLELRLYDLEILGAGSRLTLGADYQWDAVRKDQFFAMLRVRIPLGFGRRKPRLNRLERRMLDRVVRDVDVVASAGRRPVPDIREPALYDDTGQPVGRISVVDAQTPNVPQAVQGAGAGSTVIADGSRGTINTVASINVQTNQTLRGAGFRVRGARTGATAIFGTRPTIQSTTAAQDVVVVGVDSTVRDLDVVGGRFGIATGNAGSDPLTTGSLIANNRVSGAASDGFNFGTVNGSVSGNTSTGNAGDGFDFGDVSVAATVIDNSSTGNTLAGFRFQDIDGTFSNNTATQNGDDGFEFEDVDGLFSNNAAIGNSDDGFDFEEVKAAGTFRDNSAVNNTSSGYDGSLDGGTATNNTGSGNGNNNTFP